MIGPYFTPGAFRSALEARLRNMAQTRGVDLQRLQRAVAFERFLARLFAQDDPPWLLKGGYALELRLADRARSTLDLDLSARRPASEPLSGQDGSVSSVTWVHEQLQEAAERHMDDGFGFIIGQPASRTVPLPRGNVRFSVEARLAGRRFVAFHLDVGLNDIVLESPDWVFRDSLLAFAGIPPTHIALYPLAQHFADKVHAYTFPWEDRDNTRVKDLVDMALLVDSGSLDPTQVRRALTATFHSQGTHELPARLPSPPTAWSASYAALAKELAVPGATLEEGYAYVNSYWQERDLGCPAIEPDSPRGQ